MVYTFKRLPTSNQVWIPHLANNANKARLPTNCRESGSFSGTNWKGQEGWGVAHNERLEPLHKVLNNLLQSLGYPRGNETTKGLLLLLSRFSRVRLCATPRTAAHQAPLSIGFSRQEYWSGVPLPSPKGLLGSVIIRTKCVHIDVCKHRHTQTHTYFSPKKTSTVNALQPAREQAVNTEMLILKLLQFPQ